MPITLTHADPERLRGLARAGHEPDEDWPVPDHEVEFRDLQDAYRSSGGIGRGESLAQRMSLMGTGGYIDLARRLVQREVFSFQWHDDFWLPMFQFDPLRLTPRAATARVLAALLGPLQGRAPHPPDGWALAHWFVQPQEMLEGMTPLCLVDVRTDAVVAAATRHRLLNPLNSLNPQALSNLPMVDASRRGRPSWAPPPG